MISGGTGIDLSKFLINFNASDWANQANQYLQSALNQGLQYSEKYSTAALDAQKAYQQQATQAQMGGYGLSQAVTAPKRIATYNALDAYSDMLGLARPTMGSFQLANTLENQALSQMPGSRVAPLPSQQQAPNPGLLQTIPQPNQGVQVRQGGQ